MKFYNFFKKNTSKFVERWHSDAFSDRKTAIQIFEDVKKKLRIIPHPYVGWRSAPNQKFKTVNINENGLRSKSLKSLKYKENCFFLGGSVAWGFGASSNEATPAYQIEKILNEKYNLNLNVINLAEQSASSIEELNAFITSFHELNPKMIIIFSGCNDINFGFANEYKAINNYKTLLDFFAWGDKMGVVRERNFIRILFKIFLRSLKKQKNYDDNFYYFNKPARGDIACSLYGYKTDFINNFCLKKNVKVFHFLQPDLFFKKNKSTFEKSYGEFIGEERKDFTIEQFNLLKQKFFEKKNENSSTFFYSLLDCFNDYKETIFVDRSHTADKGYKILAEKMCQKIIKNIT